MKNKVIYRSIKHLISDIERDLMFHIITNIKQERLSMERAQNLAKDFLTITPSKTKREVFSKMKTLSCSHPEVAEVYITYKGYYVEEKKRQSVKKASIAIHNYEIDKAVKIVKGGLVI